jgi:aryl sulfotransferase
VGAPIERPPQSIKQYFNDWMTRDGHPFWPFWENIRSWWAIRDLPNVLLLHFDDLKKDMPGEIRRIADFLGIAVDDRDRPKILEHCCFDYMKANATPTVPAGGAFWDGGAETFINKGVNGRWKDVPSAEECAAYKQRAVAELGEACAKWLETGER